tara:strand:+ start:108 stop:482 length:375 start_codon:yes stop_codon:yes gene_type:complete
MVPSEVKLHSRSGVLELIYGDGKTFELSAEYLRVFSPSAEVQGHRPDQRKLQDGKRDVLIRALDPQGHYALRIAFSDGHDSGIFSWDYLYRLGTEYPKLWQEYLAELEAAGKSRAPSLIATSAI